ncbi:MAG: hypothetical protein ACFFD4_29195 [Candidatus Odinarchaeota archaeon]
MKAPNRERQKEERVEKPEIVSVVCLGSTKSGKTSLLDRYLHGKFSPFYLPSYGMDIETASYFQKGTKERLDVLFYGINSLFFDSLMKHDYLPNWKGTALVIDSTEPGSLTVARESVSRIREIKCDVQIIAVMTKNDRENKIPGQALEKFRRECGIPYFYRVSANTGENVREAFAKMIELVSGKKRMIKEN